MFGKRISLASQASRDGRRPDSRATTVEARAASGGAADSTGESHRRTPDLVVCGWGVGDTLQITVESQRAIAGMRRTFTIGAPPNLRRFLAQLRIETSDLSYVLSRERPLTDAYLEVADLVLKSVAEDPPVGLLVPGNPLFFNAITRLLVLHSRKTGITTKVYPALSPIDTTVCELGLDVATFGLQVFDAWRLLARGQWINPYVPVLIMQPQAYAVAAGAAEPAIAYASLQQYLEAFYGSTHAVSMLTPADAGGVMSRLTVPIERLAELGKTMRPESQLFLDAVPEPPLATSADMSPAPAGRDRGETGEPMTNRL